MIKIKLARKQHPPLDQARSERLARILERGANEWNLWRSHNPDEYIDLRRVNLFGKAISLRGVNLSEANLSEANFARVDLRASNLSAVYAVETDFQGAQLQDANIQGAYLQQCNFSLANLHAADLRLVELSNSNLFMIDCSDANLRQAKLHSAQVMEGSFSRAILAQADLSDAILRGTDLSDADLTMACLNGVSLVETNLCRANLSASRVFGTSVWKCNLDEARQYNLIITAEGEPDITVDNLRVAQFIYLMLNNNEIRDVIDTITAKVVLILGRFTPERKRILDAVRQELRHWNYTPVMFDFARPSSKSFIETVNTLAGMSRFVVADVTDAKVVLQEIHSIVKDFPSVPVQPLLSKGTEPTVVLLDFMDYPTFLSVHQYTDADDLMASMKESVIAPAEAKVEEIRARRQKAERMLSEMRKAT